MVIHGDSTWNMKLRYTIVDVSMNIAEPLENPSLHSLPLSSISFIIFSILIRFRFSTWYQSPRALTSNSFLPLPHFKKKKKSHPKHLTTNLIFSENLIPHISSPSQDRSNNISRSPLRTSTRLHALPEASVFLQVLTRRRNNQAPDLHHPGTDHQKRHHQSID